MEVTFIQALAFVAVVLFAGALAGLLRGDRAPVAGTAPPLFRAFAREIETLGRLIGPALDRANPEKTAMIRRDLVAGALAPLDVADIRGMQALAAAMLGGMSGIGTFVLTMNQGYATIGLFCMGLLGWIWPMTWLNGAARRRKEDMSRSLPYAIDLITVAMQAGQDFGAAVRYLVTDGPPGPLRQEFAIMLRETELGKARTDSLKAMADRIQLDEFRALVTSVIQGSEMGASIAQTLKIQAEEIRRARHHKAERQAARAPSLMIIPIALFILPSVFIMIFVPIILRMKGSGMAGFGGF